MTDGVFSMEGSLAKLPRSSRSCKKYGAVSVVDDSHGTGVMGKTGRGTIEHFGLTGQVDIITGTLGKAWAARPAVLSPGAALIDIADPAFAPAALFKCAPGDGRVQLARGDRLSRRASGAGRPPARKHRVFPRRAHELGFKPLDGPSAIVPIIVGETANAIAMSDKLLKRGIFVTGFGFPVVPEGTARIRTQLSAALTKDEMDRALAAFEAVGKDVGLFVSLDPLHVVRSVKRRRVAGEK